MGLPLPGPAVRVAEASARGTPALDLEPRAFVAFLENHDQVANSARGRAAAPADQPGPLPRADGAAAARARHADALPGPGVRLVEAVPLLRRPRARAGADSCATGRAEFLGAVPERRRPADAAPCCPIPATRRRSSAASSISAEREQHARSRRAASRPAAAAPRRRRRSARRRPRGVDGAVLGAEAFVLRYFGPARRRRPRCSLVNLGATCDLDAGAGAAAGAAGRAGWAAAVVQRGPALRRRGHAPIGDRDARLALSRGRVVLVRCLAPSTPRLQRDDRSERPARRASTARCSAHAVADARPPRTTSRLLDARVAGHQRPGRLRLRHGRPASMTRRYHGLLDRRPAGAARPLDDAQPLCRAACDCPTGARSHSAARSVAGSTPELHGAATSPSSGSKPACRSGATTSAASMLEKRLLLPYQQNTVHVTYALVAGDGRCGWSCGRRVHFRPHEAPVSAPLDRALRADRRATTATRSPRPTALPPLRLLSARPSGRFTFEPQRDAATSSIGSRRAAATSRRATCGRPGYFRVDLGTRRRRHAGRLHRAWETIRALTPADAAARRARAPRARCSPARPRRRRDGTGRGAGAGRRPVHHHAGRPRRGRGARARRRRRGAHGDRRLPLVHRLGPRHDDQPRRADARDRAPRRGGLHPAHVRPLRARRPDPQHVPRRRERGPLPHRRRDAVVLPRDRSLSRGDRRPRDAARAAARSCVDIVEHHLRGTRFGIGVDPADGLLRQGAEGYQLTWMDAKVDDWVVTPRRGKAVEINALWYNALRLLEGWLRRGATATRRDARSRRTPTRARESFNARFWYERRAAISTTSSTASGGDDPPAGRTSCSRSRCRTRCSTSRWEPVLRRRARAAC